MAAPTEEILHFVQYDNSGRGTRERESNPRRNDSAGDSVISPLSIPTSGDLQRPILLRQQSHIQHLVQRGHLD